MAGRHHRRGRTNPSTQQQLPKRVGPRLHTPQHRHPCHPPAQTMQDTTHVPRTPNTSQHFCTNSTTPATPHHHDTTTIGAPRPTPGHTPTAGRPKPTGAPHAANDDTTWPSPAPDHPPHPDAQDHSNPPNTWTRADNDRTRAMITKRGKAARGDSSPKS